MGLFLGCTSKVNAKMYMIANAVFLSALNTQQHVGAVHSRSIRDSIDGTFVRWWLPDSNLNKRSTEEMHVDSQS